VHQYTDVQRSDNFLTCRPIPSHSAMRDTSTQALSRSQQLAKVAPRPDSSPGHSVIEISERLRLGPRKNLRSRAGTGYRGVDGGRRPVHACRFRRDLPFGLLTME
jgi:hypothetical protein